MPEHAFDVFFQRIYLFFLKIPYQNRSYWFLFDSGNINDLLLSHRTAYEWGLQSDTVTQHKEFSTVNIQLGKMKKGKAAFENIIYDGASITHS